MGLGQPQHGLGLSQVAHGVIAKDAPHVAAHFGPQLVGPAPAPLGSLLQIDPLVGRIVGRLGLPGSRFEDPHVGLDQLMVPIHPHQLQVGPHPQLLSPVGIGDRVVALVQDQMAVPMHGALFPLRRFVGSIGQGQREQLAKDCRGVLGRFKLWRELGGGVREIGGAIRGQTEVLEGFRAELEDRLRWERVSLGKEHSEAVRGIEGKAGEFYRGGMEGSEKRAR